MHHWLLLLEARAVNSRAAGSGELCAVRPPRAHRSPVHTNANLAFSLALSGARGGIGARILSTRYAPTSTEAPRWQRPQLGDRLYLAPLPPALLSSQSSQQPITPCILCHMQTSENSTLPAESTCILCFGKQGLDHDLVRESYPVVTLPGRVVLTVTRAMSTLAGDPPQLPQSPQPRLPPSPPSSTSSPMLGEELESASPSTASAAAAVAAIVIVESASPSTASAAAAVTAVVVDAALIGAFGATAMVGAFSTAALASAVSASAFDVAVLAASFVAAAAALADAIGTAALAAAALAASGAAASVAAFDVTIPADSFGATAPDAAVQAAVVATILAAAFGAAASISAVVVTSVAAAVVVNARQPPTPFPGV